MAVTSRLYQIFEQGDDALNNEGVIMIADEGTTRPSLAETSTSADNSNIIGPSSAFVFRATRFQIPETKVHTYTVSFRGDKFTKPTTGNNEDSIELTVTFRIDKYWKIYNRLREWKNREANSYTGISYGDSAPSNRKTIYIDTVDSLGEYTGEHWTFTKCFIKNLSEVEFDQSANSEEPLECSVTFGFLTVDHLHDDLDAAERTIPDGTERETDTSTGN